MKFITKRLAKRRILESGLFDADFYIRKYPDVAAAGVDPLEHFLKNGGREARSPSARFDGPLYILHNPEAQYSDNLLLDWLREGKKGRRVAPQPVTDVAAAAAEPVSSPRLAVSPAPTPYTQESVEAVRHSGLFDVRHVLSAHADIADSSMDPLLHYLDHGWRENRSVGPEFDGHYVSAALMRQQASGSNTTNPLLYFLEHGKDLGLEPRPENSITLSEPKRPGPATSKSRVAIHIHLYYSDMIEVFCTYLNDLELKFDLLISTTTEADARFIRNFAEANCNPEQRVVVRVTPNRGRDIAPFLLGFKDLLGDYDYVCHLHSKRSPHTDFGEKWLAWVLNNLFGAPWISSAVLDHLDSNPDCCMMFPDNYFEIKRFAGWGGNDARILALLSRWGAKTSKLPTFANFAAGSMAWFRASFVAELAENLSLEDFEEEMGQEEGTLAHILERAIPQAAIAKGKTVCRYYLKVIPTAPIIKRRHGPTSLTEPVGNRWMRDTPAIARNRIHQLAPLSRIFNRDCLQISWVIPDFALGAGGHMTIFRIVQLLEEFGHRQTIWIQNARNYPNPLAAKAAISNHYRKIGSNVQVRFLPDNVAQMSGDVVIATDCWTAFPVGSAVNFKERFYFIQDYEPFFHPMGENYLIAESTYNFGFAALCAGDWLQKKAGEHGMWARRWDLAVDRDYYFPLSRPRVQRRSGEPFKIVFYGRSYTPRRAVNLGIAAFEELARRRSDFVVEMFGEDGRGKQYAFPNKQLGICTPAELGNIYRDADLGVSFSTTNYSLVPLEMMACGMPVVEVDAQSARTAFPEGSVMFAAPSPHGVADAIEKLLDDAVTRERQKEEAFAFVDGLDWRTSAKTVESALLERLTEMGFSSIETSQLSAPAIRRKKKASVVIPTYNGGKLFHEVLARAANQNIDCEYDVLVIDSSSNDGTREFSAKFGGRVRCEVIPQKEFQHGRTRNRAIELTDGDVVAVITQDAMPADENWLRELIAPFDANPRVAGAIGRHRAYAEHNRLVARDLDTMFDRFRDLGPLYGLDLGLPGFIRPGSVDWRIMMHFYSDNNSAMRRSVWQSLPYPEIDWGEDQVWCWEMLKLGYFKAYADKAVVWHSHDLTYDEQVKVSMSEGEMFARYFGYHLASEPMSKTAIAQARGDAILYATSAGIPLVQAEAYAKLQAWSTEGRLGGQMAGYSKD